MKPTGRPTTRLLATLLMVTAQSAYAHGMGAVVHPLVLAALVLGLVTGIASSALQASHQVGLGWAFAVLVVGSAGAAMLSAPSVGDALQYAGLSLILVAFAASLPVSLAYFVAYFGFMLVRRLIRRAASIAGDDA